MFYLLFLFLVLFFSVGTFFSSPLSFLTWKAPLFLFLGIYARAGKGGSVSKSGGGRGGGNWNFGEGEGKGKFENKKPSPRLLKRSTVAHTESVRNLI